MTSFASSKSKEPGQVIYFGQRESSFQTSLTSQCAPWHPFCLSSLSTPPAHSHTPASFGWLSLTLWMGLLPAPWCWGLFPTWVCLKRVDPLTHQRPKIPWLINKLPIELRWQIYGKPNLRKTCICIISYIYMYKYIYISEWFIVLVTYPMFSDIIPIKSHQINTLPYRAPICCWLTPQFSDQPHLLFGLWTTSHLLARPGRKWVMADPVGPNWWPLQCGANDDLSMWSKRKDKPLDCGCTLFLGLN